MNYITRKVIHNEKEIEIIIFTEEQSYGRFESTVQGESCASQQIAQNISKISATL